MTSLPMLILQAKLNPFYGVPFQVFVPFQFSNRLKRILVIEAECGTFPRGITEVSLWIDKNRLNLKSYTDCEGILKNTVRSEVSIPVSDVEVSDCLEGKPYGQMSVIEGCHPWLTFNPDL